MLLALYIQPTYVVLFGVVAVGSVTLIGVYVAFQVSVRVVPLSNILIVILSPSTGDPVGASIAKLAANAVKTKISPDAILGVNVEADAVEITLGVILLLVSVSVPA